MSNTVRPEEVEALISRFQASDCTEFHVRFEGFELYLSSDPVAEGAGAAIPTASNLQPPTAVRAPTPVPSANIAAPADAADGVEAQVKDLVMVRAPYMGAFYRAPKPGDPPYVELGTMVELGDNLCLVEVMKLFTVVRAEIAGAVAKILVDDGAIVEAGQPLFALDPHG